MLRDVLGGLDLELERAEHPVGSYSLDLIGTDLTHGVSLIVENQIESSDHTHLGQLLTYTAGTDAGTIVWITKSFRDEHRGALDWLNEHTGEGIRFFGVVVRALRVGDSAPAPLLELVVQPSDWQKAVRRSTPSSLSADHIVYRSFWEPLRERLLEEVPELMKGRANPKSRWLTMVSPIPRTLISGEIGAEELLVTLDIDLGDRERNLAVLAQLQQYRAVIEADAGEVGFDEGKFRCRVVRSVPWEGTLLTQPERHDEARSWLHDNMLGLRRGLEAVAPLIAPQLG